jgi:isoquinoline 1-oxidoreductase beta subunit
MASPTTDDPMRGRHRTVQPGLRDAVFGRRKFLVYLAAGSTLTVAAKLGIDTLAPGSASAVPTPSLPQPADLQDLGDVLILSGKPTEALLFTVEVTEDGRVRAELPRMEVGQGLTTAVAMLVAEELDIPLDQVDMPLAPARPELLFNQLTGGSRARGRRGSTCPAAGSRGRSVGRARGRPSHGERPRGRNRRPQRRLRRAHAPRRDAPDR